MTMLNRRDFMKVAGVTAAAGAAACDPRVPMEKVLPYVVQPDQIVPGLPTWFATQCNECSAHCGVEAKNREGRIVKLEGNREHPANNGRLCAMGLAGIQSTYSPDRFAGPMVAGQPKTWPEAQAAAVDAVKAAKAAGKEVAWLGHVRTGATGALIDSFVGALGGKAHYWEPVSGVAALRAATKLVFGKDTVPSYDLSAAHTVLSFGAEFLSTWGSVELRQGWAASRDPKVGGFVSRTVAVEPRIGNTSCVADLHLQAVPGSEAGVALAMAKLLAEKKGYAGLALAALAAVNADELISASGLSKERVAEVVGWLAANPSAVLPGGVHTAGNATALAAATLLLNEVAGNIGTSVSFGQTSNVAGHATAQQVNDLFMRLNEGKVGVLFLDGADPAFTLPGDAKAAEALAKVTVISFANEANDSLTEGAIVLPAGTTLESWGDAEARAGWHTLQQATMRTLKDTQQLGDTVLSLAKGLGLAAPAAPAAEAAPAADATAAAAAAAAPAAAAPAAAATPADAAPVAPPAPVAPKVPGLEAENFLAYLKGWWAGVVWAKAGMPGSFDTFWVECLQRGGWFQQLPREGAAVVLQSALTVAAPTLSGAGNLHLLLFPHPFVYDGRHANKPWAQEIPEPLSSYTWGSWAEIHPKTAESLGLTKDDMITVTTDAGAVTVGWFASPGIREDAVAVVMGNGHRRGGRYTKWGANPMALVASKFDEGGELQAVQAKAAVAKAAGPNLHPYLGHMNTDGRGVNFAVSIDDLGKGKGPASIVPAHHVPIDPRVTAAGLTDMYPEPEHPTYRFAMAVDLNRCTGCGACETACFSENNTAIVGPEQVRKGRHMGWIRLSRYWEGSGENPDIRFQPVICQQCSHAPCEGVCPVLATYHNLDGLNAMVYNRCVGTRYCGNNCPYTARRFNYHNFRWPESFHLMLNPEVSTREVGVMEKCSFCVQRLRNTKDQYRDNKEIVPEKALLKLTACAQACPTDAITFGNANDKQSALWAMFQDERAYTMLGELNTKPGVRYLARINHTESALHHGGHGGGHGGGHADGDHGDGHGDKAAPSGAHH